MNYKIIKAFNNNVILAKQDRKEMILVGKGIGFGKKTGDNIKNNPETIEKVFHELQSSSSLSYLDMIPKYNKEIIGVSEEIIAKAETILGSLSSNIHVALIDHIAFAVDRINMKLPIENPFTEEITLLYQEEYEVAELAASLLKERLGVDIGEDEKGFIALHLHSARNNKTIRETMKDTRLFKACTDLIIKEINNQQQNKSYIYQSFIPSLKTTLSLCRRRKTINNPLKREIKAKLYESYTIAQKIATLIRQEKDILLSEDMIAYIAIDIERIRQFE